MSFARNAAFRGAASTHAYAFPRSRPLCALLDVPVLHWHGDTFDLPDGCARLASTPLCREQAFARGPNILALQFHAEPLAAKAEHWLIGHASEVASANINPAILRLQAQTHGAALERAAGRMLMGWLSGLSNRQGSPAQI